MKEELVPTTTESAAERAWRYGLEPGHYGQFYGYQTFADDSMITILGVYRCRREAFVHSERLFARYRMERKDIGD